MKCVKCYQEIPDGSKFCPYCGADQSAAPAGVQPGEQETVVLSSVNEEQAQTFGQGYQQGGDANSQQTADPYGNTYGTQNTDPYGNAYGTQNTDPYGNTYGTQNTDTYGNTYSQPAGTPEKQVNWVPYLVLSILCTLFCCPPFGIVGIVFAAKINSAISAGDMAGAQDAAKKSRIWIIVSAIVGVVAYAVFIGLMVMTAAAGYSLFDSYYYYY